jgi:SAM-dependent methyltransferase
MADAGPGEQDYIKMLSEKHGFSHPGHHIPYTLEAEKRVGLRGKRVLEIGGSLPRDLVIGDLGASQWICIEELDYYRETEHDLGELETSLENSNKKRILKISDVDKIESLAEYEVIFGRAEQLSPVFFDHFDVIFSIAAFEHVDRLPAVLARSYDALVPGGRLFTMFAPIWSAYNGHHLHGVTDKSGRHFHTGNLPIPPWGHLLMRPPEMYRHLLDHTDADAAAEIVYHVYNSPAINRLSTEDYLEYFNQSSFSVETFLLASTAEIPGEVQKLLESRVPGFKYFSNSGILAVLARGA